MVPVRGCAIGFGGPVELVDAVEGAFTVAFGRLIPRYAVPRDMDSSVLRARGNRGTEISNSVLNQVLSGRCGRSRNPQCFARAKVEHGAKEVSS